MAKIEPFEQHYRIYEEWFEENELAYKSEILAVKKQLPNTGNGIEIGVGSGQFAMPLNIRLGVDPSINMMNIARKRGIEVICGVAEHLPLNTAQFDFVLMVTTICFLDDVEVAFKEAHRILKSDGALIIGFIDRKSPIGQSYQKFKEESVFYKSATFYSFDEVVFKLKQAGFKKFYFNQTLFTAVESMKQLAAVKNGYGEGSFVVVKALK